MKSISIAMKLSLMQEQPLVQSKVVKCSIHDYKDYVTFTSRRELKIFTLNVLLIVWSHTILTWIGIDL